MLWFVLVIIFYLSSISQGEYYLPAIVWDLRNPMLQQEHWKNVINLRTFDILTFVCPNTNMYMAGSESVVSPFNLNQNLYVKKIKSDIANFDGECDTKGAKSIIVCNKPDEFLYKRIQISQNQARPSLPTFQYGEDYMFFATSDGTLKSLNRTKNCTMVFRIHYNQRNKERPAPSCLLLGRKGVCEEKRNPTNPDPASNDCKNLTAREITTEKTNTTIDVRWKEPNSTSCNITGYGVRYKDVDRNEDWKELLVSPQNGRITLDNLKPPGKYQIQIRTYTCKPLANYPEIVVSLTHTETGTVSPPVVSKRVSNAGSSFDTLSLFIGIIIGLFIAVICLLVYWGYLRHQRQCKDPHDEKDPNDNPRFQPEADENNMEEIALNIGYRDSGFQPGWKLPEITEEDKCHSDA